MNYVSLFLKIGRASSPKTNFKSSFSLLNEPFLFNSPHFSLALLSPWMQSTPVSHTSTMKAIVITKPGGPDVLQLKDVPIPVPKKGEVLLKVAATALNRADCLQRQGLYPPPPGSSEYLGLECSGVIEEVGEGVEGWMIGQKVCALLAGGGYAEKVSVACNQLFPIPSSLSLLQAAAIPEVACTVWSTVFMTSKLKHGESFLVHGGGSGIGTFAIQLAKLKGAKVFCTAGSEEKLERCRSLGADVAINYKEEDFVTRVKQETDGKGVDVILDNMGASYLSKNIKCLSIGGRLFVIGLQGGRMGDLDLGSMLVKRLTISSAGLRSRPSEEKAEIVQQVRDEVWKAIESGSVKPAIHCALPLSRASEAHALMESSQNFGKIVLTLE